MDIEALRAEIRAELRGEMKAQLDQIREETREQLNEERAILHQQVDAAKTEASEATARFRASVKPADMGHTTLNLNDLEPHERPSQRRNARPLPTEGTLHLELVHGSFVGSTLDRTYWPRGTDEMTDARVKPDDSREPAQPGEVLRFDMKNALHRKSAQALRDSGCAERV